MITFVNKYCSFYRLSNGDIGADELGFKWIRSRFRQTSGSEIGSRIWIFSDWV